MPTIRDDTSPVAAVWFSCLGGTFLFHTREDGFGWDVLDDDGSVIGSASDYVYGPRGFSVHTRPYAGFVPREQVRFV